MNSYSYILLFCLICVLGFTSCVDKIALPETTSSSRIYVECELSPPFYVRAKLSTTGDLNGNYYPTFPEDATLRLYSSVDEEFTFQYNEDLKLYEITNNRLRNNLTYTLSASVKDTSIRSVYATTGIPLKGEIDLAEVINVETFNDNSGENLDYITLSIKLLNPRDKYFRLYFDARYVKLDESKFPAQVIYRDNLMGTELNEVIEGGTGVHISHHLPGVLVDPSQLINDTFKVKLKVDRSQLDTDEFLKSVYIKLMSVTEPYYRFHISLSKQLKLSGKDPIEPVIDYTNINNGYGVIGAFVTSTDSVSVQ